MNLSKMLSDLHPELKEKYASEQYKLAKKIIAKKLSLKVSQPVLAYLMGVSYDKYLEMENGSIQVPVTDYEKALEKIDNLKRTELNPIFIDSIPKFPSFVIKQTNEPVEAGILFNIKDDSLLGLNRTLETDITTNSSLKTDNYDFIKERKLKKHNSFIDKEFAEEKYVVKKMNNSINVKGIEKTVKYSFELKEENTGEIPISA